jgi:hypothetical protein
MKSAFLAMIIAAGLTMPTTIALACGGPVYGKRIAGFSKVGLELTDFLTIEEAVAFYSGSVEEGPEAPVVAVTQEDDPKGKYAKLVTVTKTKLPDDSMTAHQMRLAMNRTKEGWIVMTAGDRWKCARGKNTTKWTTKLCP